MNTTFLSMLSLVRQYHPVVITAAKRVEHNHRADDLSAHRKSSNPQPSGATARLYLQSIESGIVQHGGSGPDQSRDA
jgi:hypothetical protein